MAKLVSMRVPRSSIERRASRRMSRGLHISTIVYMRPIMPTVCRLSRAYHFDVRRYTGLNLNCRAPGSSLSRVTVFDHFSASKSPMIDTIYLCIRVSSISTTLQRVVNDTVCQRYLTFDAQLATRPKRSREPLAYTSCSADTTTTSVRELTKALRWQLRTTHWQSARTGSRPGQPVMPIYYLEPAHDQRIRTPRTRTTMTRVQRGRTWTRRRTPSQAMPSDSPGQPTTSSDPPPIPAASGSQEVGMQVPLCLPVLETMRARTSVLTAATLREPHCGPSTLPSHWGSNENRDGRSDMLGQGGTSTRSNLFIVDKMPFPLYAARPKLLVTAASQTDDSGNTRDKTVHRCLSLAFLTSLHTMHRAMAKGHKAAYLTCFGPVVARTHRFIQHVALRSYTSPTRLQGEKIVRQDFSQPDAVFIVVLCIPSCGRTPTPRAATTTAPLYMPVFLVHSDPELRTRTGPRPKPRGGNTAREFSLLDSESYRLL